MFKSKTSFTSKAISLLVIFAFTMYNIVPLSSFAAIVDEINSVTFVLTDEDNNPVADSEIIAVIKANNSSGVEDVKTVTTSLEGKAIVNIDRSKIADNNFTIIAYTHKEGFNTSFIKMNSNDIPSDNIINISIQHYQFTVNILPNNQRFSNHSIDAVIIPNEIKNNRDYKIEYKNEDENDWTTTMPLIKNVGIYRTMVKVIDTRSNNSYIQLVSSEIQQGIFELDFGEAEQFFTYNGRDRRLITLNRNDSSDDLSKLLYTMNGVESEDIPIARNVGTYNIHVHAEKYGYHNFDKDYTVKILPRDFETDDIIIKPYSGRDGQDPIYDGQGHNAFTIYGANEDDTIEYSLDGNTWNEAPYVIKDAKEYNFKVRVSRANYNPKYENLVVNIEKDNQILKFNNEIYNDNDNDHIVTIDESGEDNSRNKYDFSAYADDVFDETINDGEIVYKVENASDDGEDISNIASIDSNGILTIKKEGIVDVTASRVGNANYNEGKVVSTLIIKAVSDNDDKLIWFDNDNLNYIFGESDGVISSQRAKKKYEKDNGIITYSIDKGNIGLKIDRESGELKVDDYTKLEQSLTNSGGLINIQVTADKTAGKRRKLFKPKKIIYDPSSASYNVVINFMNVPSDAYEVAQPNGNNDWYTEGAKVSSKDNTKYSVGMKCDQFSESVIFTDQGSKERHIFIRDIQTGGISSRIPINVKIDSNKPSTESMEISYSKSILDTILENISFGFYKANVEVTFTASDDNSGIDCFNWTYNKQAGASDSIVSQKSGTITAEEKDGKSIGKLVLPEDEAEQYRGNISFTATDKAGLVSNEIRDDKVIVRDNINPEYNIEYSREVEKIGDVKYYSGDITAKLIIKEANFFRDDVNLKIYKNGQIQYLGDNIWNKVDDENTSQYTISGDGEYYINVNYKDKSENTMEQYVSDKMIIDTADPIVNYEWDEESQSIKLMVTDKNFIKERVSVNCDVYDVNNNKLEVSNLQDKVRNREWTKDGDKYSIIISDLDEGYYDLAISYEDPAGHKGEKRADRFLVDHSNPTSVKIDYSKSIVDTILESITFGYYKPDVTVTFTSYDKFSGVDSFYWNYTRSQDASESNLDKASGELEAKQDNSDKSKYTAKVTLPEDKVSQIKGFISASAKDRYGYESDTTTDTGKVIVVDTIAPTLTVSFNECSNNVDNSMYYKDDAIMKFEIKEANFDEKDVLVKISKDNGVDKQVNLVWTKQENDEYTALYTLDALKDHSNDGKYVLSVSYTDKSHNIMKDYKSEDIIIDTTKPEINVSYDKTIPKYSASDIDGNKRDYFEDTVTANITITEKNFNKNNVNYKILCKDVSGKELDGKYYEMSDWINNGDRHSMSITYPGSANYTFDMDLTDLSSNKSEGYNMDYFTVDKTKPTNLEIQYSSSLLDKVINAITFGFYNSKPIIKIKAEDNISKIHEFNYSYLKAAGVSNVNKELRNQIISEESIKYSNDGSVATATFEVPKEVLNHNNQFNGTVQFKTKDRSGNENESKGYKHLVVDNISPKATVTLNSPSNTEGEVSYYDKPIVCSINIDEANFYKEDVIVRVTKDGKEIAVAPKWSSSNVDSHNGTFTLNDDGDYTITIDYSDKSLNKMTTYSSGKLTIDTKIKAPEIFINGGDGNGKAYKDKVIPSIKFSDENLSDYEVSLTRTRFNNKNIDVTDEFIGNRVLVKDKEGQGIFDTFDKVQKNDGIYIFTVKIRDKAGHVSESTIKFTVNRFGSVYEYNDYLSSLIYNGGAYVKLLTDDLVVTEYNADKLIDKSLAIDITCDGRPLDNVDCVVSPEINHNAQIGESGWYQYRYVIRKSNFTKDGVYKISISSKDEAGNAPENINYKDKNIIFRVDSTSPEITSITGLDNNIINSTKVDVKYTVFDAIGIKSITVYIDGKQQGEIISKFNDINNYSGSFVVGENNEKQDIRLVVEDLAGNITDTSSKTFKSMYGFKKEVIISTNAFIRWYANRTLFWITIICIPAAIFLFILIILLKRKKKEQESVEQ